MATETIKSPGWLRAVQIVLGAAAVGLSAAILVFPVFGIETAIVILSVTLLVVGFERIAVGIGASGTSKWGRIGNIILGVIAVGLGFASLAYPLFAIEFLIFILSIGLLFAGFAKIIEGVSAKRRSGWARAFLIGVGILAVIVSSMVMVYPVLFGIPLLVVLTSIGLLVLGAEAIASGVSGERYAPSISRKRWESDAA